jgi:hypothetical protein
VHGWEPSASARVSDLQRGHPGGTHGSHLLGKESSQLTPETHRYRITAKGLRAAIFYTRLHNRSLRTGLAIISSGPADSDLPSAAEVAVYTWYEKENLAA